MAYVQEFGFNFSKEDAITILDFYLKVLVKFPKDLEKTKEVLDDKSAVNSNNTRTLKITINHDFRALIVICQTVNNILIPPKYAFSGADYQISEEIILGLLDLMIYLKRNNNLVKLLDVEHGQDIMGSAINHITNLIRSLARFVSTECYNKILKDRVEYILTANNKGIVMPFYEMTVWYVEIFSQFSNQNGVLLDKSEYFHQKIFPILWQNFPEYKVLDDRTIYLLDRYLHLVINKFSDKECLLMMDTILSSLIVRMKLPVGKSGKDCFSSSSITSSEIANFGSYTLILLMIAGKVEGHWGGVVF